MGKMHFADSSKSDRLTKMLDALSTAWQSTAELFAKTYSMAVSTDISELRKNGYNIPCEYRGKVNGRKVYVYRIA